MGDVRERALRRGAQRQGPRHADPRAGDGGLGHEGQVHHPKAQEGPQLQAHGGRRVVIKQNTRSHKV